MPELKSREYEKQQEKNGEPTININGKTDRRLLL
jgi:hypothetical protein